MSTCLAHGRSLTIVDLPPELITHILFLLNGRDIGNVSMTCQSLRAAAMVDTVWQSKCIKDYKLSTCDSWQTTFRDIYTKVLYKYGTLLGLWQLDLNPYGGVVHVSLDHGKILARQYSAPVNPHIRNPLRAADLFSISLQDCDGLELFCLRGYHQPHNCEIVIGTGEFTLKCCDTQCHRHPEGKQKEFEMWVAEETGMSSPNFSAFNQGHDLLILKFITTMFHREDILSFKALTIPSSKLSYPIQPGLFKGHYGSHGIEVVQLSYTEEGIGHCTKVTGDPNVPAGVVSLYGDTQRPMMLTDEQQQSIELMEAIDIPDLPPDFKLELLPRQTFHIPLDCMDRNKDSPKLCKYRFHSQGRIAGHGYTNPTLTPCHWIIFNEMLFGVLWLELRTFSIFSRVEDFT